MYNEQLRQHEALLEEAQRTSHEHAQTVSRLEAIDQTRKSVEASSDTLKLELAKTKVGVTNIDILSG